MTDGAARALARFRQPRADRARRAAPHEPRPDAVLDQRAVDDRATGGSDVGLTETVARQENGGWRLYGRKWFTSATTSQMALTLARPEGNPPGGQGARALLRRDARRAGTPERILVNRLKDKLGTRKLPTAELDARRHARGAGRRLERRRAQHRADAQRHAHLERVSAAR